MKKSTSRVLLRKENKKLASRSSNNYWTLLALLAKPHVETFPGLYEQICARDIRGLVDYADYLSSQKYEDAITHYVANQISLLIRKYPFPGCEQMFAPEAEAVRKFLISEQRCHRMNKLIRLRREFGRDRESYAMEGMRQFIRYVIGDCPNLKSVISSCGFGPGASIGVHGNATNPAQKLMSEWSVSPSAFHLFDAAVHQNLFSRRVLYAAHGGFSDGQPRGFATMRRVEFVGYNKIEFVPKTVRTYRSIAVEPLGNSFVQKGIDLTLRKHLQRVGLDLTDQTANQRMAREGSLDDSPEGFVTLDLSSASDSISIELCRELLPYDWFRLLDGARSKNWMYNRNILEYSKFCSMGNGFCFPLQTLIFAAVCHVSGAGKPGIDFRVYGDDIIIRKKYAERVTSLLFRCGFRLNLDKSHVSGPFRESCGADWFGGVDVRPYTLDFQLDSVQNVFKFLNLTKSRPLWAAFFEPCRDWLIQRLSSKFLFWRPFTGPSDTGLDSSGDEHLSSKHCKYAGNGVWKWKELQSRACTDPVGEAWFEALEPIQWYAALGGLPSSHPFTLRRKTKTSVRWASHAGATSQWLPT